MSGPVAEPIPEDDDDVPVSVRLGTVVPPEDPEDWTRPLTWVAAVGMLAAPAVAAAWFVIAPPAGTAGPVAGTWLLAAVLVAGNPAREIKQINPRRRMITREALFADAFRQAHNLDELDKMLLQGNSFLGWLRALILPRRGD